jgi:hypothetical protein
VVSFRCVPSVGGFTKRYKLHYQPKKMTVDGGDVLTQYGCINFHAKCYRGQVVRLTVVIKNKWSGGWTRAWFYCKVPLLQSPNPLWGRSVYALHSCMPSFDCADDDVRDVSFVHAASLIGGREAVAEYLACRMFPLSTNFGFGEIADGETPASKVKLGAENVVRSYSYPS